MRNLSPVAVFFSTRLVRDPSTFLGMNMQRSSMCDLMQAATFALPSGHPVIEALNRALSSGLAGDIVHAKDALAALQNHDPKSAEHLAFAYRTLNKANSRRHGRAAA